MHIYKYPNSISAYPNSRHTLRFVGSQVGRLLPADPTISIPISPRPSPLAGPPFSPSVPSAPHWVKSRLTHCSSRGNRYSHLSPNMKGTIEPGPYKPSEVGGQNTSCKVSKGLIQHGGDKTFGCRNPKSHREQDHRRQGVKWLSTQRVSRHLSVRN